MAYIVDDSFREKLYSGESNFRATLIINGNTIPNDQIASISISSPIIDDSKQVFNLGSFISQKITIKFKNMENIIVGSGQEVSLSIGQYINNDWTDVPIGLFLVDDLAEDYFEKCEISCLDYAVKFKPNIDYSECFVDGKATIETILKYICNEVNVQLGSYPTINNDIEIGTYDSTVSGKQWISYIAEIKGCNAKMDRQGRLTLQPLKQSSNVPINALESASFELGEKYKISQVVYFDALRNYTFGNDKENTLYIRQENPFINDENVIKEIYKSIINEQRSETEATDFDLYNTDEFDLSANKMYGETSQETGHGYQMLINTNVNNGYNYWSEYSTYDKETRTLTKSTTATSESFIVHLLKNNIIKNNTTYTLSCWVKQNGKVRDVDFFMYGTDGGAVGIRNKTYSDIGTNWVKKTWTFTTDASANYTNACIRFDNNGSTTSGQEAILYVKDVMLEEGSVAHDYEDYPTSPDNPHNVNTVTGRNVVKVEGENLCDITSTSGMYYSLGLPTTTSDTIAIISFDTNNIDFKTVVANYNIVLTNIIQLKPNTQYTIKFSRTTTATNNQWFIYNYDNGTYSINYRDNNTNVYEHTFTTNNTGQIALAFGHGNTVGETTISNIMLNEGSTATEYEPYQSQEYEIDLGKNLFDKDSANIIDVWVNGNVLISDGSTKTLYIPCEPNTKYTVQKTVGTNGRFCVFTTAVVPTASVTILNYVGSKTGVDNNSSYTIITHQDAKYLCVFFTKVGTSSPNMTTILDSVQIEKGSVATDYSPYYTVSKNLFNKNNADINKGVRTDNGNLYNDSNLFATGYIPIQPNIDYVANKAFTSGNGEFGAYYDSNKTYLGSILTSANIGTFKITNSNAKYLRLTGYKNDIDNWQIEKGSVATYYEPYDKHIELCKIGDYQDYITKSTGKNLFDGVFRQGHHVSTTVTNRICSTISMPSVNGNTYTLSTTLPNTYKYKVMNCTTNDTSTTVIDDTNYASSGSVSITCSVNGYLIILVGKTDDSNLTPSSVSNYHFQLEQGSTATDFEPYGKDEWYEYHNIGKVVLNGSEDWQMFNNLLYIDSITDYTTSNNVPYSNYFKGITNVSSGNDVKTQDNQIAFLNSHTYERLFIYSTTFATVPTFKTWLGTHNTSLYYQLTTPEVKKITYQPLIDQLNAIENMKSYEGKTYITSSGVEENSPIDIKYYINTDFELWSLKTHNYGDFTLDAWDNINYELGDKNYLTLNNNTINYEMTIMGDVNAKIPTKQQEVTTNVVGGDDSVNIKKIKTEVDNLNGTATILAEKTDNNSDQISQLRVDINAIQNLFTLTGGGNSVRNSAFLLTDEVWNFTDNGANPYHTTFGKSYEISLAGKTASISEIKLQDTIAKTNSDNITGIRNDGTRYNLSFYYKQDADTTTTIKLYDTNNSSVKAFDDIIITGEKEFRSYNISFVPTSTNYTLEIVTSTTSSAGAFYLYDLMLNSGDRQPWSPAPDEVYSTTLTMSRLGLKVYSVGDGTITLLGSDGLVSYETTDGKTLGRLVSKRTVNGDLTKSNTSELIGLVPDIVAFEERTDKRRWVDTTIELNSKLHKITYLETGE